MRTFSSISAFQNYLPFTFSYTLIPILKRPYQIKIHLKELFRVIPIQNGNHFRETRVRMGYHNIYFYRNVTFSFDSSNIILIAMHILCINLI